MSQTQLEFAKQLIETETANEAAQLSFDDLPMVNLNAFVKNTGRGVSALEFNNEDMEMEVSRIF